MTDETKVEATEATEEVAEVTTEEHTPVEKKALSKSPEEIAGEHKERQGKKATKKKKVKSYTKAECLDELKRLEKTGHQQSQYYKQVKARALAA